jgi:thiol:disulfide interchange protein DsbD
MAITNVIFGMGLLAVAVWLLSRILSPAVTLALCSLLVIFPVMLMLWKKRWRGAGLLAGVYSILLWVDFH